jgi:putative endonuclease
VWWLYVLRCGDGSLYTGIALDVGARLAVHAAGKGARYTRGRGPLALVGRARVGERGDALSVERRFKRLPRADKDEILGRPRGLAAFVRRARAARASSRG